MTDDKPDPTTIDLERATRIANTIKRFPNVPTLDGSNVKLIFDLIAAIEALREREADWDGDRCALVNRAEAAQAREIEIAGALEPFASGGWVTNAADVRKARTALASTPAEALERSRAVQEIAKHLWLILPLAKGYVDKNNVGNNMQFVADAEEALDALDKESTP